MGYGKMKNCINIKFRKFWKIFIFLKNMKKLKKIKYLTKRHFLCQQILFIEIFKNSKTIKIRKIMYIRDCGQIFYKLHIKYLKIYYYLFFSKVIFFCLRHYFMINENNWVCSFWLTMDITAPVTSSVHLEILTQFPKIPNISVKVLLSIYYFLSK